MKTFKKELYNLLCIEAPSGQEEKVVDYVKPVLEGLMDKVFLDDYGNLLAEKVVGDGLGATILLSAHMDTVNNLKKGRKVIFNHKAQTFRSSKGILGADDRAGIAIILAVLRNISKTSFNGKILVSFSREEEIGCVGAGRIDTNWYKGANLAIVVDRRGSRDIVTGTGYPWNFCSEQVGQFFEDCSALLDMDWKSVGGGISDACTFSENGVHSVNLSAGYENEHTDKEYVNISHSKDTINLILQAFSTVNSQYQKFGEIPLSRFFYGGAFDRWEREEESYWSTGYGTFIDREDPYGRVVGDVLGDQIMITQNYHDGSDAEIFVDDSTFKRMIDKYCRMTNYTPNKIKYTTVTTEDDKYTKQVEQLKTLGDNTKDLKAEHALPF